MDRDDTAADVRALLASGDPAALELLYDRHAAGLHAYALALVGVAGADDVIQELFSEVATHRRRVAQATNLPAYLTTMVRHLALRWRRQHPNWQAVRDEALVAPAISCDPAVQAASDEAARADRMRTAVTRLPPELAEVVALHAWDGQTFATIGQRLDLAPSTVGERWQAALALLRRMLPAEDAHD